MTAEVKAVLKRTVRHFRRGKKGRCRVAGAYTGILSTMAFAEIFLNALRSIKTRVR